MAVLLHPHPVLLDSIAALPDRFKDNFLERKVEQTTTTEAEKVKKKPPPMLSTISIQKVYL